MDALPENDCRYAVYDFEYTNADGCLFKKIIFVMWSPDNAATKSKMMYASSKDFLKNLLPGIAVEQQATEKGEVDEEDMRLRIQATITRKVSLPCPVRCPTDHSRVCPSRSEEKRSVRLAACSARRRLRAWRQTAIEGGSSFVLIDL